MEQVTVTKAYRWARKGMFVEKVLAGTYPDAAGNELEPRCIEIGRELGCIEDKPKRGRPRKK